LLASSQLLSNKVLELLCNAQDEGARSTRARHKQNALVKSGTF